MSRYNGYEWWEWAGLAVILTLCIGLVMWFCYGVWGPHYPPAPLDPKKEFTTSCEYRSGIPNTNTTPWTCAKVEQ